MHDLLKKKNMQRKKNIYIYIYQNALNIIASMYSRRCGSSKMYFKGDSPH